MAKCGLSRFGARGVGVGKAGTRVPNPTQGFTLLEVLIALVVVAVAVGALAHTVGQSLNHHHSLEQRTLALWVANNVIAAARLDGAGAGAGAGRRQGRADQGGRAWYWEALVQPAPGNDLIRIDVTVFDDPDRDRPVLTHTGFLPP